MEAVCATASRGRQESKRSKAEAGKRRIMDFSLEGILSNENPATQKMVAQETIWRDDDVLPFSLCL
jgi:hypothetical protein